MGTRTLQKFRDGLNPFVGGSDVEGDWVDQQINAAYDEITGAIEFAGAKTTHTFTTADGTASYNLPSDFMGPLALADETNDKRLLWMELADYYKKNPDSDQEAKPEYWSRDGSCMYLWPTPDASTYSMKLLYLAEPTHLSDPADVTVIPTKWDQSIHLLAAHYCLLEFAVTEEEITRAETYFIRAMRNISSRKTDRNMDQKSRGARGLNVARSFGDLVDQDT